MADQNTVATNPTSHPWVSYEATKGERKTGSRVLGANTTIYCDHQPVCPAWSLCSNLPGEAFSPATDRYRQFLMIAENITC
ncbi:jg3746 [Pararge aegeria aegeria]|uniref:Jg3746 protein n=1 Tax=Pararge aegeria aegeria TaxID=348720 RepID=A0A8S4QFY4_9NEOP|nr:jg3746 [Pararge aegeria aegeria]